MHPLLEDPWIAARIEAAVAPYAARLSAEDLAFMKDQMAESLVENDKAAKLLRRARPAHVDESGEVRRDQAGAVAPVIPIRGKKKAG